MAHPPRNRDRFTPGSIQTAKKIKGQPHTFTPFVKGARGSSQISNLKLSEIQIRTLDSPSCIKGGFALAFAVRAACVRRGGWRPILGGRLFRHGRRRVKFLANPHAVGQDQLWQ